MENKRTVSEQPTVKLIKEVVHYAFVSGFLIGIVFSIVVNLLISYYGQ